MLRRRILMVVGVFGLVSFGLGCGIAVDRVQAARQRTAGFASYREALEERNRRLMAIELQTHGRHEAFQREWQARLDRIQEAVVLGDTRTAVAAWREAYGAAMRGGLWRDLIEVGDAALRVGDVPEFADTAAGAARKSYLTALYRAQAQRSRSPSDPPGRGVRQPPARPVVSVNPFHPARASLPADPKPGGRGGRP